ncbi:hypothetical protein [Pseudoalteromonas sp. L1]|uniref:tetratricopeptide repeat protein n=1 Tax=Pseudoalteromonas sp. L1 TaxID=195716 RepID=UPI001F1AEED6|nr:hypothetical protein [Pseudoalteromonas sp. L1]
MKLFSFFLLFTTTLLQAEPYIPNDQDVIASSRSPLPATLTKYELATLFEQNQWAGKTESNQGLLKNYLSEKIRETDDPDIHYYYARLLQREHKFELALAVLNDLLKNDPSHVNSILLKANILKVQGQFAAANSSCLSLMGKASIETISTCSLDVKSQMGDLAKSYEGLKKIIKERNISMNTRHVLAEMAYRLNMPEQTLQYLNEVDLAKAPVSLVVLWANAQLALGNNEKVLVTLSKLTADESNLEDALLLRLAQAELNKEDSQSSKWQTLLKKRVTLRELRQDTYHASDLAWYYLMINHDPTKATYWANVNWQHAKLESDKRLLELATKNN